MAEHDGTPPPPGLTDREDAGTGAPARNPGNRTLPWADPAFQARISAAMAARWQDPAYRERASGNHRDDTRYRWRHLASGRIVTRTKVEMREEFGLKADALNALAAGRNKTSRGWALEPKPRMPPGPRWIFP